jgi:phage terminase large subunit GpA-like protein
LLEAFKALEVRYATERRYAAEAHRSDPMTILAWAERYRQIDGQPFSLERFEPLRAIYEDEHPDIVVIKPAQRGVSEWAVNYASFAIDRGAAVWTQGRKTGLNVGYIFPTKESLNDFSKERFSGLGEETEYLQALFDDGDDFNAVTFKQVGQSYLYLRGGWSTRALKSFPADVIILDEYDEMATGAPALARRRMNASVVRRSLRISTPTIPGRGIHDLYLQSDRRVYEQQHGCGAWVSFDFWRDVRVDGHPYDDGAGKGWRIWPAELIRASDVRLHCPSCQSALSDEERIAPGRWRAEMPDVTGLRGYWIPWWPFPVADLVQYAVTAVSQDPSELTELYRSDLGLPYESSGSRITREMLAALSADMAGGVLPDLTWLDTTLGVDVGKRFHYRVSSRGPDDSRYVRAAGSVATWDEVDALMTTYGVRLAVLDAFPEQHAARAFVDRHPGKAVTATYPTANALKGVLMAPDAVKAVSDGRVQINRTMAMDAVYAAVARAQERWPAALHNDPEVIEHMTAPVRVTALDAHGQPRADWVHTKPDHLYHASVYDLVAGRLLVEQPPEFTGGMFALGAARDSRVRR